jgi:hypothetical protein
MKLTIKKVPQGLRLELNAGKGKPVAVTLSPGELAGFIKLIEAASRSESFELSFDLPE